MSQFGLLDRRARLANLSANLSEAFVVAQESLQHIRGVVLEVTQHNRIATPVFQAFRTIT